MKNKSWLMQILLLFLPGPTLQGQPLPGLYFTNAVVLSNGLARLEICTPDPSHSFVWQYSDDLQRWRMGGVLPAGTNRFVLTSPEPVVDTPRLFLRAAPLGQQINTLGHHFNSEGSVHGVTLGVTSPAAVTNWSMVLEVENTTNFPASAAVLFTGPPGTLSNSPARWGGTDTNHYEARYESQFAGPQPPPAPTMWTVHFGSETFELLSAGHQAETNFVVMVPQFLVETGELKAVSWCYSNVSTGLQLTGPPAFVEYVVISARGLVPDPSGSYDIYFSGDIPLSLTNHVFDPALNLFEMDSIDLRYGDLDGNEYWNNYRVVW